MNDDAKSSEAVLIERIARRDEAAFEKIFEALSGPVMGFLSRMAGRGAADDLLQEVFIRVWKSASTYSGGDPRAWVFTVARNVFYDHLRKKKRNRMTSLSEEQEEMLHSRADDNPGADALEDERARMVRLALDRLPDDQREVIVMKEFSSMKFHEIAAATGAPMATVKSRMRYGLVKMREYLKEYSQ